MRILIAVAIGTIGALLSVPVAFGVWTWRRARKSRNRVVIVRPELKIVKGGKR